MESSLATSGRLGDDGSDLEVSEMKTQWGPLRGSLRRRPAIAGLAAALVVVVGVATVVAGVRQDSWEPVWLIAWLPAVLVGSLARTDWAKCWPRLRRRAQR
jgi:hypothetical protein